VHLKQYALDVNTLQFSKRPYIAHANVTVHRIRVGTASRHSTAPVIGFSV